VSESDVAVDDYFKLSQGAHILLNMARYDIHYGVDLSSPPGIVDDTHLGPKRILVVELLAQ
jgi:hypothetical protein